jgi:hypothetical protein
MRTKARGAGSANSGVADCDRRLDAEKPAALSYFTTFNPNPRAHLG